jgi:hypothetical protein
VPAVAAPTTRTERSTRASPFRAVPAMALCAGLACSDEAHIRLLEMQPSPPAGANSPDLDASTNDASSAEDASVPVDAIVEPTVPGVGLALRYDFRGTGARVLDGIGDAHADVLGGAQLDGQGGLTLDGENDYVDMPNRIVSRLDSASFVVWLEWLGTVCWQRVFDFGISDAGEDRVGNAVTSLFMTPESCGRDVFMVSAEFSGAMHNLFDDAPLPRSRSIQVALTIDVERNVMTMFVDGVRVAQGAAAFRLRDIDDRNNWLGRSQWVQDLFMNARYDEFRIYDRALSAGEVAALHARGPDQP